MLHTFSNEAGNVAWHPFISTYLLVVAVGLLTTSLLGIFLGLRAFCNTKVPLLLVLIGSVLPVVVFSMSVMR